MRNLRWPVLIAWVLCALVSASAVFFAGKTLVDGWYGGRPLHLAGDTLSGLVPMLFAIPAALIISRLSRNTIGWLFMTPAVVTTLVAWMNLYLVGFQAAPPPATLPVLFMVWFSNSSWLAAIFPLLLLPLIFPNGRPPSPRWRWVIYLAVGMILFFLVISAFAKSLELDFVTWRLANPVGFLSEEEIQSLLPSLPWVALLALLTVACLASIVFRYRRAARVERQQMKWLLYASAIFALIYLFSLVVNSPERPVQDLADLSSLLLSLGAAAIPVAVMIAILRYHLFDIDVIIRLTLVYTIVTALLALVYAGGVVLLQAAFRRITGQLSDLAVILTTLAIAVLFNPVRQYVQALVNRRFYRQKYNAEQALAEFASLARGGADLDALSGMLVELVEKTLQPTQVSVYLRGDGEKTSENQESHVASKLNRTNESP